MFIILILQIGKLRHRGFELQAYGHIASGVVEQELFPSPSFFPLRPCLAGRAGSLRMLLLRQSSGSCYRTLERSRDLSCV